MDSLFSAADCAAMVEHYAGHGVGADLAERTYTARLLGSVPRLVMHGGGNTSVKTALPDLFGEPVAVLCVKGSGRDLGTIEPAGHPAVKLASLARLRTLDRLSDEEMVNVQRQNLIDAAAPNPSVETLLHAWLPHKFVDHTHAVVSTAIACLPNAEAACREIFGGRVGFVRYIMPGFALAKEAASVFERDPSVDGLLLGKHGLFTFAQTARRSYELMIEFVTAMERYVAARARDAMPLTVRPLPARMLDANAVLPVLRAALGAEASAARTSCGRSDPTHWLLSYRTTPAIRRFTDGNGLADYGTQGVATPEQVIRIKRRPAVLPPPDASDLDGWSGAVRRVVADYAADYQDYFTRGNAASGGGKIALDPLPRVFVLPGMGIVGVGRTASEAVVSADVAEAWIEAVVDAVGLGGFSSITEAEHFEMEYWSLEQAKLGRGVRPRFAGQVAVVTGGAGTIGAAVARAFAAEGAAIAVLDRDGAAASSVASSIGAKVAGGWECDVTDRGSVQAALAGVTRRFGGVDVVVSNAGAAVEGSMAELDEAALRASFELNFFGHQWVAAEAVRLMRIQKLGGVLLFNVSKQAVNPGVGFGAYGTAKAALLALARQYALELGGDRIRVNGVNADRIRSGLLDAAMIASRAAARGVSEADYMAGNLLRTEVRAEDVAAAFVAAASLDCTTGHVLTVDGGNVAAMLR